MPRSSKFLYISKLALAGDICAEDTDENAQALFSLLMDLFPDLAEPAAQSQTLPEGFLPIPLLEFCGWMEDIPEDALIFASEKLDGAWTPVAEYEEKLEALLDNADEMVIVGKLLSVDLVGGVAIVQES